MSDQSILQIDTDEELARVMRQLKTLPQQLGAPNVLKNALNSTARKVRRQIINFRIILQHHLRKLPRK